jgi:hypothetical protein
VDDGATAVQTSLSFAAPEVEVVGSYVLHTMVRPHLVVDVAVEMPARCFLQKDYRDHRYHGKRALYLQHLVRTHPRMRLSSFTVGWRRRVAVVHLSPATSQGDAVTSMMGVERVDVECLCGDFRKPTLVLTLAPLEEDHTNGDRWRVRLIPGIHEGVFPAARLAPEKANLRSTNTLQGARFPRLTPPARRWSLALPTALYEAHAATFSLTLCCCTRPSSVDEGLSLSPLYNHSILEDMALPADTAALVSLLQTFPELEECIVLLKVISVHPINPAHEPQHAHTHTTCRKPVSSCSPKLSCMLTGNVPHFVHSVGVLQCRYGRAGESCLAV